MARPQLRIVSLSPLTLEGADFQADEHVRLAVSSDGDEAVRKVRASTTGSFETIFEGVRTGRSVGTLSVSADGDRGSSVSFALHQPQSGGGLRV
jgi:hypothetical protein